MTSHSKIATIAAMIPWQTAAFRTMPVVKMPTSKATGEVIVASQAHHSAVRRSRKKLRRLAMPRNTDNGTFSGFRRNLDFRRFIASHSTRAQKRPARVCSVVQFPHGSIPRTSDHRHRADAPAGAVRGELFRASVARTGGGGTFDPSFDHYRIGGSISKVVFWPLETLDRRMRPGTWKESPNGWGVFPST
jgi:hypothetical protein